MIFLVFLLITVRSHLFFAFLDKVLQLVIFGHILPGGHIRKRRLQARMLITFSLSHSASV